MARPLRICLPEVTYHCYSRCIETRNMLSPDYVKDMAIEAINEAMEVYDFELIQLEFVENHFHIVIRTTKDGPTISRIMQYIKARTTEKYNRAHGRTGTLWNERFKCRIIEQSENPVNYLLWLLWYIAYNPVRKGVIKNPRESSHGGILAYLHEDYQGRLKITHHRFFMELGDTFAQRVRAFLQFELSYKEYLIYTMGSEHNFADS